MRLALRNVKKVVINKKKRRIHAQRRAREINNIMVGWRDAQGKQRI
jgi:hypothetical protein